MSGIKINFLNQTPQITAPQTMQNTGFAPIFNFFMPPMNFLPSFGTFDSSFDEFQNMFFNSIRMMEYNIPKAEITGSATVSEHCPTQDMSCMVTILLSDIFSPLFNPQKPPFCGRLSLNFIVCSVRRCRRKSTLLSRRAFYLPFCP